MYLFYWLCIYSVGETGHNERNCDLEGLGPSPSKMAILNKVFCTSGPNLVILAWTRVMVWTTSKWGKLWPKFNLTLKSKLNCPTKTTGILTKVFYTSDPNLVILGWMGDDLLHEQARDCFTHTHTHWRTQRQMQEMTISECQNWHRCKQQGDPSCVT